MYTYVSNFSGKTMADAPSAKGGAATSAREAGLGNDEIMLLGNPIPIASLSLLTPSEYL